MTNVVSNPSVLLLVGHANVSIAKAWSVALARRGVTIAGVIVERRGIAVRRKLLEQRIRKLGPLRALGQLAYRMYRHTASDRIAKSNADVPPVAYGWEAELASFGGWRDTPILEVESLRDHRVYEFAERVKREGVGLAAVYGTSLLSEDLIRELPELTLNLHTGLTQFYRGVNSSFWALADGEPGRIGVTVHRVSPGIDTGSVLAQRVLGPDIAYRWRSMAWLDRAVSLEGERLLVETMIEVCEGRSLTSVDQMAGGVLTTDPTLYEYWDVLRRFKLR